MNLNISLQNAALNYLAKGLSVIPFDEKKPLIPWKQYQYELPTEVDTEEHFSNEAVTQLAIVLGSVSGDLEVLQIDDPTDTIVSEFLKEVRTTYPQLHDTLCMVRTPKGGYHVYYRCENHLTSSRKLAQFGAATIAVSSEQKCMIAPPTPGYKTVHGDMYNIPVWKQEPIEAVQRFAAGLYEYLRTDQTAAHGR